MCGSWWQQPRYGYLAHAILGGQRQDEEGGQEGSEDVLWRTNRLASGRSTNSSARWSARSDPGSDFLERSE